MGWKFSILPRSSFVLNAALGVLFGPSSQTMATDYKPLYRPFAFIDISSLGEKADLIFDKLTARLKQTAKIDLDDFSTANILETFGEDNPQRFQIQYVDESGAKIQLGQLTFQPAGLSADSPYLPGVHYVVINLGYAQNTMPEEIVAAKVADLVKEAEDVCKAANIVCVVRHRLA